MKPLSYKQKKIIPTIRTTTLSL